jgi:hypothetical protein
MLFYNGNIGTIPASIAIAKPRKLSGLISRKGKCYEQIGT